MREFISQFRGMSASAKQAAVLEATGAARTSLADLFDAYNKPDKKRIAQLLKAMQANSKPVKPADLGVIGEAHLRSSVEGWGALPESIRYKKISYNDDALPFVIEAAFGLLDEEDRERELVLGLNFSPAIGNPFRDALEAALTEAWTDNDEDPVALFLHVTCPRFSFTDRGKGSLAVSAEMETRIAEAITSVTREWTRQSKAEHKEASAKSRRRERLTKQTKVSQKDAAYAIMKQAYLEASSNGELPTSTTQIMYAARGYIQDASRKQLDRTYFNSTLLPSYLEDHPEETAEWRITYDDRGHFTDPHTKEVFGLGTEAVDRYLGSIAGDIEFRDPNLQGAHISTCGPQGGYGAILFVEKEGFLELFDHVNLAQRYDIAIMSTKGLSVTAARRLVDELCSQHDIPLLVLHDFDKAGFSILGTLQRSTRRYQFQNDIEVIDLGLRLDDVERLGLQDRSEEVFDRGDVDARTANMLKNGATEAEVEFLLDRRVELNALTSSQLIAFLEDKFAQHGIRKVVPSDDELDSAYRHFERGRRREEIIRTALLSHIDIDDIKVPEDLSIQVNDYLERNPTVRWDEAVAHILACGMEA